MGKVFGVSLVAAILLFASPADGHAQAGSITASLRIRPMVAVPTVQIDLDRSGDRDHPVFTVDADPSWRVFLVVDGQRLDLERALDGPERQELRTASAGDRELAGNVGVRVFLAGAAL